MPTIPVVQTLTNTSVDILNVIRNNASQNFQDYVPKATAGAESVREIGAIIMDNPALQNEFLSALVNRIGMVMLTSKMYMNPWAMFKRGMLEYGETIEEIFVNIATPFQYDPAVAESKIFAREIPDVRSAFHIMNYQKFYKNTVQNDTLRKAFLSWQGITDLVAKTIDAMYTGANNDEFLTMKYMVAKHIYNGQLKAVTIPAVSAVNMKSIVAEIKAISNEMEFLSTTFNIAGVHNATEKGSQYFIINSRFDAIMDVEVLASAFNMDKAKFLGQRVLVDGFGKLDQSRLALLFANDPTYTTFTQEQLDALDEIPALIVDRDWFMIFDNFYNMTEQYNGEGLYWNYWYHTWKTFSISPFGNNAMFIPGTPAITSITVSPATVTISAGQKLQIVPTVVTAYFASKVVNWSVVGNGTVSDSGLVTIDADAEADDVIVVTATCDIDATKTATCTITVA